MGVQNVEQISDRLLKDNLADFLYLKKHYPAHILISSIMGFSNKEWAYLAKVSEDNGADMLELNFSCPHMCIEGSGHHVGQAFDLIEKFTTTVKNTVSIPVIAKMTPNITDMTEPAIYAKNGGADAISAINTVSGISEVGLEDLVPKPNIFGIGAVSGTSGPAIKPIGLHFIADMAKCEGLALPLSGIGGIETWIDALEYILLGASTIQVTTGIMHYGYRIVEDMIEGLSDFMAQRGITRISDLVGKALPNLKTTDHFDLDRQGIAQYDLDKCVGCGQCYTVCTDAAGQAIEWDAIERRPKLMENKCLSCMLCSFVCPVPGLISFKEMPAGWRRDETRVMDKNLESEIKIEAFTKEGPNECTY
ncbi:NAD-dependent dihydropyrimidine dehydrogenase subunit PreA [Thermodesulfobacteriota bacterium]